MKNNHTLKQLYYTPRTAIEAEILFTARIMQVRFLELVSGKTPREQSSSGKKIGAESAVLHFVFFEVMVNKMQESAKESCLLRGSLLLGMKGFKAALDFGVGAGLQVTWKKEKE